MATMLLASFVRIENGLQEIIHEGDISMLADAWWEATWLWIFKVWQIPLFLALIALIVFYKHMRNKQV